MAKTSTTSRSHARLKPSRSTGVYGIHPSVERWAGHVDMPAEFASPAAYPATAEVYVEQMLSGPKSGLRPIYDALLKLGLSLGGDTKACPCKTIVPIYRRHVIAQIKPAARTRIDFGLALGNTKTPKRLIDTGGFKKKDRITHRIEVTSLDDIDDELKRWLKKAYEMDV